MGACLRAWSAWLSAVAETLPRNDTARDPETRRELSGWAARCRRLAHRLTRMASEAPFAEVADAPPRLMLSAVFRNDPAYRHFFRLWQDMNLGIAAVFGDFLNMPLARTFVKRHIKRDWARQIIGCSSLLVQWSNRKW
jgi:hypothetical protein